MFDWNDEELADIIWGEAREDDDHIVPYPDGSKDYCTKKEQNQEAAGTKPAPAGQKILGKRHDFPDLKLESTSNFDKHGRISSSEVRMDSWPDLSSSSFVKNDQESINSEVSIKASKNDSEKGETAQPDRDQHIFENPQGEEDNDFVDYGWENIGSFDDLDRIFSNDEPLFGHVLGNADELWSSKDVTNSSIKSFSISGSSPYLGSDALTDTSEILQVKKEGVPQDDLSLNLDHGKVNDPASLSLPSTNALPEHTGYGDKSKPAAKEQGNFPVVGATTATSYRVADRSVTLNEYSDKVSRQKKLQKGQRKSEGKTQGKLMRDVYGAWSSPGNSSVQYEHLQLAPAMMQSCAPSTISQLRQIPPPESYHYQHLSNPYLFAPAFGNVATPFPGIPSLSLSHSGKYRGQTMISGYEVSPAEVNPINKQVDSTDKPPTMTPQEKIEKLRRRQQMQAMLAIQKQQEQFSQQVSGYSIAQKCHAESQTLHIEGSEIELDDTSTLPPLDINSAVEQDDSNTISVAVVDYAAEDIVLRRLQDVIAKLDSRIRLCIRDSLFRLAKSAVQRHYTSDTNSTNMQTKDEHGGVAKEERNTDNREVKMPDVETETNPIDRAVAHLLFHRPLEPTIKHPAMLDSPLSTKLPSENKIQSAANLPEGSKSEQGMSLLGPKSPTSQKDTQHLDLLKTSPSENTSTEGVPDSGTMELEASQ